MTPRGQSAPRWQGVLASLFVAVGLAISAGAALPALYLGILTIGGLRTAVRNRVAPALSSEPMLRFAVCVPAHDEEAVIGDTLAALVSQDYPVDRFAIHVVADNCSDRTVDIALAAGVTVHERTDPTHPGKGPALNWLRDRLKSTGYDVLVVIDADSIARPDFLEATRRAFAQGALVTQGYYGVLDPDRSPAVALRFAALASRHYLRPLGRASMKSSAGLYGNGMGFAADVIAGRDWSGHLIEDAEFQLELLLDGIVVTYVPEACLEAEMPDSLAGSQTQNQRWELGRIQLIGRFVPQLVSRLRNGGPLARHVYADAVADQLTPPVSVLASLNALTLSAGFLTVFSGQRRVGLGIVATGVASTGVLCVHVLASLRLVGARRSVYHALWSSPRLVLWKLSVLKKVAMRPDVVTWTRTARNAGI